MNRVFLAPFAALLLLAAAGTPPATAQAPTAPHLSAANNILYAHHHDSDTTEAEGWMNTLFTDPTANDIALGPTGQFVNTRTFKLTLAPALTQEVKLDKTKPAVITAYMGGGSANGVARVTATLDVGTTRVIDGAVQNHVYQEAGTGQYPKLTWSVNPAVDTLPVGQALVWTITATGAGQALFLSVSAERGASNITLPVVSPADGGAPPATGPTINYHNETGDRVEASISSEEATNGTHQYNWTTELESAQFTYDATITNGSVRYTIKDGENNVLADETLTESGNATELFATATSGNWTVNVTVTDFVGAFTFSLAPPPEEVENPTSSSAAPTTGTSGGNTTAPSGSDESTPGPGLVLFVAAALLGLAAARRGRRLP